jgi:drug/metabolite transporter (DMT)-like permease
MTAPTRIGSLLAVLAFVAVGSSVTVAGELTAYPAAGGQAARYAVAAILLLALNRFRLRRPSVRELAQLVALSATGLVLFNLLLVEAVRRADTGSVGAIVGAVPVVLVVAGPLLARERVRPALLVAAAVVALGAAVVQGAGGRLPLEALVLALGVLACEACFGLLARPLIPVFGPAGVSAWIALLAAPMLLVIGLASDGTGALPAPTAREALALAYMAVVVTAGGFVSWYGAIARLGVERAGLFSGVLPVTALLTGALLGHADITLGRIAGVLIVAAGITAGLRLARAPRRERADHSSSAIRAAATAAPAVSTGR